PQHDLPLLREDLPGPRPLALEDVADAPLHREPCVFGDRGRLARIVRAEVADAHLVRAHAELLDERAGDSRGALQVVRRTDGEVLAEQPLRFAASEQDADAVQQLAAR